MTRRPLSMFTAALALSAATATAQPAGPVTVIRVPRKDAYRRHVIWHPPRRLRAQLTQFGLRTRADLEAHRAAHLSWLSDEELRLAYGDGAARSF